MDSDGAVARIPELLETYGGRIYGLGLRMCGSPQDAEDLVQETFLQAFRKWDQFEGRSKPSSWLYTIAARLCQRRKRRRAGEPQRLDSLDELLAQHAPGTAESTSEDPFQALSRKEAQEVAEMALAQLPPRFRLPLLLKELADLSIADISELLGIKQSTVKTRIHRGRMFLAAEMSGGQKGIGSRAPSQNRKACLELVEAKQEAIDRGLDFPVADEELCDRCRMLFRSLDLANSVCRGSGASSLPPSVKRRTITALTERPS